MTCLPGCFALVRIQYPNHRQVLTSDAIIEDYARTYVETLHDKNLLFLGEDRYLTTLLLKHFPKERLDFIPSAISVTNVPSEFKVLLSQRRRWINSTFHNLLELLKVKKLCGWGPFSLRTLIFLDLFSSMILPLATAFFYFTVVYWFTTGISQFLLPLIGTCLVYGFHLLILLLNGNFSYIPFMFYYLLLGLPIFNIILPLYAFWHFDEFSWGTTRKVDGDKGDSGHGGGGGESKSDPHFLDVPRIALSQYIEGDQRISESVSSGAMKGIGSMVNRSLKTSSTPLYFTAPSTSNSLASSYGLLPSATGYSGLPPNSNFISPGFSAPSSRAPPPTNTPKNFSNIQSQNGTFHS